MPTLRSVLLDPSSLRFSDALYMSPAKAPSLDAECLLWDFDDVLDDGSDLPAAAQALGSSTSLTARPSRASFRTLARRILTPRSTICSRPSGSTCGTTRSSSRPRVGPKALQRPMSTEQLTQPKPVLDLPLDLVTL